jgi:hypothetical protein
LKPISPSQIGALTYLPIVAHAVGFYTEDTSNYKVSGTCGGLISSESSEPINSCVGVGSRVDTGHIKDSLIVASTVSADSIENSTITYSNVDFPNVIDSFVSDSRLTQPNNIADVFDNFSTVSSFVREDFPRLLSSDLAQLPQENTIAASTLINVHGNPIAILNSTLKAVHLPDSYINYVSAWPHSEKDYLLIESSFVSNSTFANVDGDSYAKLSLLNGVSTSGHFQFKLVSNQPSLQCSERCRVIGKNDFVTIDENVSLENTWIKSKGYKNKSAPVNISAGSRIKNLSVEFSDTETFRFAGNTFWRTYVLNTDSEVVDFGMAFDRECYYSSRLRDSSGLNRLIKKCNKHR